MTSLPQLDPLTPERRLEMARALAVRASIRVAINAFYMKAGMVFNDVRISRIDNIVVETLDAFVLALPSDMTSQQIERVMVCDRVSRQRRAS